MSIVLYILFYDYLHTKSHIPTSNINTNLNYAKKYKKLESDQQMYEGCAVWRWLWVGVIT
jgi:hypothetical protein